MLALALGAVTWPTLARLVRGEFLTLREREFVDAAKVAGGLVVRRARDGETLKALDGKTYALTPEDGIIAIGSGGITGKGFLAADESAGPWLRAGHAEAAKIPDSR